MDVTGSKVTRLRVAVATRRAHLASSSRNDELDLLSVIISCVSGPKRFENVGVDLSILYIISYTFTLRNSTGN